MKKALITGITGQDGSYLAEFLLENGYEVHGITRRASLANTARIEHIMDKITLHDGDLSDSSSLIRIINIVQPDEIYNLAAQSHVQVSFDVPEYSGDVDALGVLRILEACRILGLRRCVGIWFAAINKNAISSPKRIAFSIKLQFSRPGSHQKHQVRCQMFTV